MRNKSLLIVFIVVFIITCNTRTSFSLSLMDEFNNEKNFDIKEPSLEDILRKRNPVHLTYPLHIKRMLDERNMFPLSYSQFIHLCKYSYHKDIRCIFNGLTKYISIVFVRMDDVTSLVEQVEILFHPSTGKAFEIITRHRDNPNQLIRTSLKEKTKI